MIFQRFGHQKNDLKNLNNIVLIFMQFLVYVDYNYNSLHCLELSNVFETYRVLIHLV